MAAGGSKITQLSGKKFSVLKRGQVTGHDDACLQIPAFGRLKQKGCCASEASLRGIVGSRPARAAE